MEKNTSARSLAARAGLLFCAALVLAGLLYLAACGAQGMQAGAVLGGAAADFRVAFIDVGQGDAILISCGGQHMLVDAGTAKSADGLVEFLAGQGVETLAILAATHPHADHIGGMEAVLGSLEVDLFIMPQAAHTTATFERMLDAVAQNGCPAEYAFKGSQYALGEAEITVLSPVEGENHDNLNNYSLVMSVEYGGIKILLTGDAEGEIEARLTEDQIGRFSLVKLGHHGSNTSSSQAFLDMTAPAHAVISCGAGNDYGHPHREVLERLGQAAVWRTDKNGTVFATVSGGELHVQAEK